MLLPALKNSVPASLDGQSIEDFIRNSTQNLQHMAAAMPGSGVAGAVYLGFDGTTGTWKLNKEVVDPKSLGRILVPQHGLFEGCIEWANVVAAAEDPAAAARRSLRRADVRAVAAEAAVAQRLQEGHRRPDLHARLRRLHARRRRQRGVRALLDGRQEGDQRPGDGCHPGGRRLRRDRPPGDRARLQLVRESPTGRSTTRSSTWSATSPTSGHGRPTSSPTSDIITRPTASRARLRRETKEAPAL